MHFQIFIPDVANDGKTAEQILDLVGLRDLAGGAYVVPGSGDRSPNQQPGMVVGWVPGQLGFRESGQTWEPSVATDERDAGAYYVGFWDDSQPTPEELQRRRTHRGELVELANGTRWYIPCVHTFPKDVIFDQHGETSYVPKAKFEPITQSAAYWLGKVESSERMDFGELCRFLADLLKLNYRITPEVCNHLRLFDTDHLVKPLSAFLGIQLTSEDV